MDKKTNIYYYQSLKNDVNLNFRISSELKAELSKVAEKHGTTVTEYVTKHLIALVCEENRKEAEEIEKQGAK